MMKVSTIQSGGSQLPLAENNKNGNSLSLVIALALLVELCSNLFLARCLD